MKKNDKGTDSQQRFHYVYNTIRKRICLLDYEPGQRLSEEKLAQEFNISRTPIRRVLTTLESEGMVEIRHGSGNYVSTIELDYLCDIYSMRMELVMLLSKKIKQPLPENILDDLKKLLKKGNKNHNTKEQRRIFAEINLELFELTMQMTDSRALQEILSHLFYKSSRMWPYLLDDCQSLEKENLILSEEIIDLIRVLENGNYNSISTILRFHIESALYRLQSYSLQKQIN